jgi:hypothetical protein
VKVPCWAALFFAGKRRHGHRQLEGWDSYLSFRENLAFQMLTRLAMVTSIPHALRKTAPAPTRPTLIE